MAIEKYIFNAGVDSATLALTGISYGLPEKWYFRRGKIELSENNKPLIEKLSHKFPHHEPNLHVTREPDISDYLVG